MLIIEVELDDKEYAVECSYIDQTGIDDMTIYRSINNRMRNIEHWISEKFRQRIVDAIFKKIGSGKNYYENQVYY